MALGKFTYLSKHDLMLVYVRNARYAEAKELLLSCEKPEKIDIANMLDNDKNPIIFRAVLNKDLEMFNLLMSEGADINSRNPRTGQGIFEILAISELDESHAKAVAEQVLKNGTLPIKDRFGFLPSKRAENANKPQLASFLRNFEDTSNNHIVNITHHNRFSTKVIGRTGKPNIDKRGK